MVRSSTKVQERKKLIVLPTTLHMLPDSSQALLLGTYPEPHVMAQDLLCWCWLHIWTWSRSLWTTQLCNICSSMATCKEINISRPKIRINSLEDFLAISGNLPWQHFLPWNKNHLAPGSPGCVPLHITVWDKPMHRLHNGQGSHLVGHV